MDDYFYSCPFDTGNELNIVRKIFPYNMSYIQDGYIYVHYLPYHQDFNIRMTNQKCSNAKSAQSKAVNDLLYIPFTAIIPKQYFKKKINA